MHACTDARTHAGTEGWGGEHGSSSQLASMVVAVGGAEAAAAEPAAAAVREALGPADVGAVGPAHAGAPEPVALRLARPRLRHLPCTHNTTHHTSHITTTRVRSIKTKRHALRHT